MITKTPKAKIGSKKVKTGDTVLMIAGNNKGQTGKVMACIGDKVLVQGINVVKKHVKPSEQNKSGGIVEMEKPVHVSNVCPCDKDGKPVKLSVRLADGKKSLVYSKDGQEETYRVMKEESKK